MKICFSIGSQINGRNSMRNRIRVAKNRIVLNEELEIATSNTGR